MADTRLKDFTALSGYTNLAADDLVYMADHSNSDGERKVVLSDIKNYALGGKTIGGTSAGDIITNNATQTMTNKTLTSPIINTPTIATPSISAATMTGTTVLPATTSIGSVSGTEIGYLNGATSNIQNQLTALSNTIGAWQYRVYCYSETFLAAGNSTDERSEATIMTGAGVPSGYRITPSSLQVMLATFAGSSFTRIDVATANLVWVQTTDGSGTHLVKVKPTLSAGTTYNLTITFKVYADPA